MRVVVQKRGKLWIYGDGSFVLEVPDLDVEASDLSVELAFLGCLSWKRGKGDSPKLRLSRSGRPSLLGWFGLYRSSP